MFLAPFFLLGLLAIGVPIWLHRVARANPVRYPFPSLMLLEQSETQRTAQRTLRYWMLLLLRILLLIALAFAFAGPLLRKDETAAHAANARLHAIVLDASFSMQHPERWARALEAAESVLESLRSADHVMLVRASGRHMDIVQDPIPAREAGTLRAKLASLAPGRERLDFGFAMSTAEQWLRTPRPPVLLHVISDFQRSGAPLRFADLEPPPGSQLVMHDVAGGERRNVFIGHVALDEGDTRSLEVDVRSTSDEAEERSVIVLIEGKERARRTIHLDPSRPERGADLAVSGEGGGRVGATPERIGPDSPSVEPGEAQARVVFEDVPFEPGSHRIEVRLEPNDTLADDDRFFAVLEHADPNALLLARDADSDEGAYFAAAIGALTAPRVNVTRAAANSFEANGFRSFSVLIVPDMFALSTTSAARLEQYVRAGGALLATLGAGTEDAQHPLVPDWQIGKPRPRLVRIGEIDGSHPILRNAPEWHQVRFFRQRPVEIAQEDRVLIAQSDGTPLLIERTLGAGRMLILTSPIDRQWNDLAIHPAFVQFVSQATRYLIGGDSSMANVTVGAPVTTGLTDGSGGQIFGPSGERVLGLAATTNAERLVPTEIGFYEIRHASGVRWLAVNVDRRESDLHQLDADYLARWQALRQRPARSEMPTAPAADTTERRSLGPMLLWIAALLLLAEVLMANRYLAVRREVAR